MDLVNYIDPALLALIPALVFVGAALKHSKKVSDSMIPLLLGLTGILLAVLWVLATSDIRASRDLFMALFTAIVQGILCAATAVYGHQLKKQSEKSDDL